MSVRTYSCNISDACYATAYILLYGNYDTMRQSASCIYSCVSLRISCRDSCSRSLSKHTIFAILRSITSTAALKIKGLWRMKVSHLIANHVLTNLRVWKSITRLNLTLSIDTCLYKINRHHYVNQCLVRKKRSLLHIKLPRVVLLNKNEHCGSARGYTNGFASQRLYNESLREQLLCWLYTMVGFK